MPDKEDSNTPNLRIIKTARDKESINQAARKGYFPLVKKVERSEKIRSKYAVLQNNETGEIDVIGDYRVRNISSLIHMDVKTNLVIDFTFFYPYDFPSPYAAYLIPKDLIKNEKVLLEDLIQDYVGESWNQGDIYRLKSCEAIWNGDDFDIQYKEKPSWTMIG